MTTARTDLRPAGDDTLTFLARGYDFGRHIWRRARSATARAVPLRLLGGDSLLVRGADGVELFYDPERVERHGAMPAFIQETLFGHDSVHSLDGAEHLHRKQTFLQVTYDPAQVARLQPHLEREWAAELDAWIAGGERTAYDAAIGAIGRAMQRWAGLPGTDAAKTRWARRQAQIVDGFGTPYSPEFLKAAANRWWSDRHAAELIEAVRAGTLEAAAGTALHAWAWHREADGELLPAKLAGIELQNSFRPAIAVSRFVAFAAKELHDRPEWRARIAAETTERGSLAGGPLASAFAQEVRRTAPFVPMLPATATTDIELDGERLEAGGRVLLDILGTNTDRESWERAHEFDPERFVGRDDWESIDAFVPQGGGHPTTGHRCPGEEIAVACLAAAIAAMSDPRVTILGEGLEVNRRRLPTKPASGGLVRSASAPASAARCPFH
ncbi:cytochrome P450 [Agrococcus carbonis]|uniref:Fatty-acid peroxygenase n=1 Tax=Agrococcus carbonis TaxID=684552 RepID=A0A1H1NP17_9MICO|nr:cytochrome P450 [Agrococcus carbonis]SDS00771.1 fatty-acid peroxygenase [Agrococcus carbonis]